MSLTLVAGWLSRFPLHVPRLMASPPPSERSADQWHRPWGGCDRRTGWVSPLTCIYLETGLQEQTKVNCKPRCPSKKTKVKARHIFNKMKSTDGQNFLPGIHLWGRVTVIRSKYHMNTLSTKMTRSLSEHPPCREQIPMLFPEPP